MFSVDDFILKFEKYTDEELLNIHSNISGYSNEAQLALDRVINSKGGLESLLKKAESKAILLNEEKRIAKETEDFGKQGIDASFIKTITNSTILSDDKVKEIIDRKYEEVEAEIEDKKIKPRTIIGSIIGGGIASIIGGTFWGLQMIYSKRMFYIFFVGLALLSYYLIKALTKQTKNNTFVFIATIISVILALFIGQLLYEIFGYRP
jgi:hypothetical protein